MDDKRKLARAARQIIQTDEMLGGEFIPLGAKPLPKRKATTAPAPSPQPSVNARTTASTVSAPAAAEATSAPVPPPVEACTESAVGGLVAVPHVSRPVTTADKVRLLAEIDNREVKGCVRCGLCKGRTQTVFGEGDPDSPIVFVGEGPGEEEDKTGRPFVGRAGQLLTKMIEGGMSLPRERVFIANTVKCRPPGNRPPAPDEAAACRTYLARQLAIIRPKAIVALGNPAMGALTGQWSGIMSLRGKWRKLVGMSPELGLDGIAVRPTFHPSFVLRTYTAEVRRQVWEDLIEVLRFVGLPTPTARG